MKSISTTITKIAHADGVAVKPLTTAQSATTDGKMTKQDGTESIEALHDRRRWIATVSRWTLLAGVTAIAGLLAARKWSRGCTESASVCPRCQLLGHCQLPQARSIRGQSQEERVNG
jgi:hypothetical protein